MKFASPLRYPGGKACLAGFLAEVIELNELRGCTYYEPYAGGAGAALSLLRDGWVSEVFINDADERVSAFWLSVLNESNRFVDRVLSSPVTMHEWYRQREVCANPNSHESFDVGFAAFFMNRCNRSGVLTGAGPIGGLQQKGKWRLDVRFSRESLAARILALATLKDHIHVARFDAIEFLKSQLPRGRNRSRVFVYLDPPYVHKGQRLYLNAYETNDHALLALYLERQHSLQWIMSYDDTELVRSLYIRQQIASLPVRYSLQNKRYANELIIAPKRLALPCSCKVHGKRFDLSADRAKGTKS
jgi:DNA adenine methylase